MNRVLKAAQRQEQVNWHRSSSCGLGVSAPTPSNHPSASDPTASPDCAQGAAPSPKATSPTLASPRAGACWDERSGGGALGKRLGRCGKPQHEPPGKHCHYHAKANPFSLPSFRTSPLRALTSWLATSHPQTGSYTLSIRYMAPQGGFAPLHPKH